MWFITTITNLEEFNTRTVGWFNDYDEAEKIVLENQCDLWETIYDYAVIDWIPKGLYQSDGGYFWFKFNIETSKYELVDCPKGFENIIGIGIG